MRGEIGCGRRNRPHAAVGVIPVGTSFGDDEENGAWS
jgi:hypothetical protein